MQWAAGSNFKRGVSGFHIILLGFLHENDSMEKMPASLLVVPMETQLRRLLYFYVPDR